MVNCAEPNCAREGFWNCDCCDQPVCTGHYSLRAIPIIAATGRTRHDGQVNLCAICREKSWRLRMERA